MTFPIFWGEAGTFPQPLAGIFTPFLVSNIHPLDASLADYVLEVRLQIELCFYFFHFLFSLSMEIPGTGIRFLFLSGKPELLLGKMV